MTTKRRLITDSFKVVKRSRKGGKREKSPTPPPSPQKGEEQHSLWCHCKQIPCKRSFPWFTNKNSHYVSHADPRWPSVHQFSACLLPSHEHLPVCLNKFQIADPSSIFTLMLMWVLLSHDPFFLWAEADRVREEELEKLRQFDLDWSFGPCTGKIHAVVDWEAVQLLGIVSWSHLSLLALSLRSAGFDSQENNGSACVGGCVDLYCTKGWECHATMETAPGQNQLHHDVNTCTDRMLTLS